MIYGSIFEGFRNRLSKLGTGPYSIHKLFTCFMCLATWMGFVISAILAYFGLINLTPWGYLGSEHTYLIIFLNGLLSGAGVWLTHTLQEALERAFVK
jgi:polyferredoxin